MTNHKRPWVDRKRWSEGWESLETLSGGGQGHAKRVHRIHDGCFAFLKVIKSNKIPERRARFFREVSAYDTIRVQGIPRLIESNAHRWEDTKFEPYIATDFIQGSTLRQWRDVQTHVALKTAIEVARQLLVILRACHANDVVHRDVKPENIILANDDPSRPVLLDFGLSHHESEDHGFATEDGQEVGNRFLRLPELSAGSRLKQDLRSDLSFVAGILFYILTGQNPNTLQNAQGQLPHQRRENYALIRQTADSAIYRLLFVFDSGFAPLIVDRFTSAEAMLKALDGVMKPHIAGHSKEDLRQDIRDAMDTAAARRQADTCSRFEKALRKIERVFEDVRKSLEFPLNRVQTGWNVSGRRGHNILGLRELGSDDDVLLVKCEVWEAGDEIVVSLSGDLVFRTSISAPSYGNQFDNVVSRWLLSRLRDTLYDTNALPPEAHCFGEHQPLASLEDARVEACRRGRNVIAFVYDLTEEKRSNLEYHLSYFLQNRKTRETISTAFIIALVPLSQVEAITDILNNESMESARWIVFDHDLKPLIQNVIYANAQEGERIALTLAEQFSR